MNGGGVSQSGTGHPRVGAGVTSVLATLKDVSGIAGSFVFTSDGNLVAREIHAMFDDSALSEAAQRLSRLADTFATVGDHLELAVIRFQDHKLYLKVLTGGMLCILADGVVNMAALRMAANLVGRRIAPDLEVAKLAPPPQEAVPVAVSASPSSSSAGVPRRIREIPGATVAPPPPAPGASGLAHAPRRFRGRALE